MGKKMLGRKERTKPAELISLLLFAFVHLV